MSKIIAEVEKLVKEGKSSTEVKGYLAYKGIKGKELAEIVNKFELKGTAKTGSLGDTLKFIEESARTEKELYEYIIESGTKNEARWISSRNSIRLLANRIVIKMGGKFKEVEATASLKAKVKEIVAA